MNLNPRYVAYAKAHGCNAHEMFERDRAKWPGRAMTGFLLWINAKRKEFFNAHPEAFLNGRQPEIIVDQDAWTRFLEN